MANDLVPSGSDGSLVVTVDSRKAIAGLSDLESRLYGFVHSTETIFNQTSRATDRFNSRIRTLSNSFDRLLRRIAGFLTLREAIRMLESFIGKIAEVNRVFTGFVASMGIIRGSAEAARKEYGFLLAISDKLGIDLGASISQYHRLAAALKNVDSSGELARHVFTGISEAALVLQSRGHDTTLIFEAIQQMASKGKLSLEELQRQLGNTLPGAVSMAARAMMNSKQFIEAGVTTVAQSEQFLRKSIQNGTINVYEFLARVADQLKQEYGGGVAYAATQFQANLNRMKLSVFEFFRQVGDSGAIEGLVKILQQVTRLFFGANDQGAAGLGRALGDMFSELAEWLAKFNVNDITEFFAAIRGAIVATGISVDAFIDVFQGFGGADVRTPLLNFVEFMARTLAALVDVFAVAFAGIETLIRGFIGTFQHARELVYIPRDWALEANSNMRGFLGIEQNPQLAEYHAMRENQRRAMAQNDAAYSRAARLFVEGPEGGNAYDRVTAQFAQLRAGVIENRYGVDTQPSPLDFSLANLTSQFKKPEMVGAKLPMTAGMPAYLLPGRAKGEGIDKYVNPLGGDALQKLIDSLTGNAPNSGSGGSRSKAQNAFLREQTRLLKGLATAENEYSNVIEGRSRKEGQHEAQMRSLIRTDERYSALSEEKQTQLLGWARSLDEANKRVQDAIRAQEAWNDAMMAGYAAERQIEQLRSTGFMSKYTSADEMRDSFKEGGENQFVAQQEQQRLLRAAEKKDADQRLLDMAKFEASVRQSNDEMLFQAQLIGLGAQEQQRLTEFRRIDLMVQELSVGASDEMIQAYRRMGETLKSEVGGAMDYVISKQSSMALGLSQALADFADQASNVSKATYDVASNVFNGLADLTAQFAATGKANFGDFVRSAIADFARMEARIILSKVFSWIANWAMGWMTGGVTPGYGTAQGNYNWASSSGFGNNYGNFAKGEVFSGNSNLTTYLNGVYDTPQFFQKYAKGGVFAEAGAEAIMPLAKDASGELGVKVKGGVGGGGGDVYVTVQTNVQGGSASSNTQATGDGERAALMKEFSDHMGRVAQSEIQKSMRPGGTLWKAGVTQR